MRNSRLIVMGAAAAFLASSARAQEQVDATWAAFDAADSDARRSAAAAAFPILKQRRTRAELADRERNLHRTATAACRSRSARSSKASAPTPNAAATETRP